MSNIVKSVDEIAIYDMGIEDLQNKDKAEIQEIARGIALDVVKRVANMQESLQTAKELSESVKDIESDLSHKLTLGIFGKSALEKKVDINTQTQTMHLAITQELAEIQKLTIGLCMSNTHFTKHTLKEFDSIIKNGFKDSDGKIQRLNENAKAQIQYIKNNVIEKRKQQKSNSIKFYIFGFVILAAVIFVVAMFIIKK